MTADRIHQTTFKKGSTTYFHSSLFFPCPARDDVFVYGFVRSADDFVDRVPQDEAGFHKFAETYKSALNGTTNGNSIIDSFVQLMKRKCFDPAWVEAFLRSMELDLKKSAYATLDETLEYIYGAAEVIGLFMARITDLPQAADRPTMLLGRTIQYINFIRDIKEDLPLGRQYLSLEGSGLDGLEEIQVRLFEKEFIRFIRREIERYLIWQEEEKGYRFIPQRLAVPVKTAADMYKWTGIKFYTRPLRVYEKKVNPSALPVMFRFLSNWARPAPL